MVRTINPSVDRLLVLTLLVLSLMVALPGGQASAHNLTKTFPKVGDCGVEGRLTHSGNRADGYAEYYNVREAPIAGCELRIKVVVCSQAYPGGPQSCRSDTDIGPNYVSATASISYANKRYAQFWIRQSPTASWRYVGSLH